jgi:hypothetical protein
MLSDFVECLQRNGCFLDSIWSSKMTVSLQTFERKKAKNPRKRIGAELAPILLFPGEAPETFLKGFRRVSGTRRASRNVFEGFSRNAPEGFPKGVRRVLFISLISQPLQGGAPCNVNCTSRAPLPRQPAGRSQVFPLCSRPRSSCVIACLYRVVHPGATPVSPGISRLTLGDLEWHSDADTC